MSGFWSLFVVILTVFGVVSSVWLLQVYSKRRVDEGGDTDTTGHVWDENLREYNKPLPMWWLGLFWITVIFTVVYLAIYPGMGNFAGLTGWTQGGQYEQELQAAEERYGDIYGAFAGVPLTEMATDPDAVRLGRNLYLNYCTTCHGSDGRGAVGFPNLTDGAWLYGDAPEVVQQSISNGRIGVMPALGAAVGEQGVDEITAYVLSLSGRGDASEATLAAGQEKFVQFCSACHGPTGVGVQALGGPNLTDESWLHGGSEAAIRDVILNGRVNQMPAQSKLLTEDRIRTLVAYVISLGSGAGD
jgi:cytochrome c oxidase cbb3-type subunit 3